jgi:hypothetical protein
MAQVEGEAARVGRHLPFFREFALQLIEHEVRGAILWRDQGVEYLADWKFIAVAYAGGRIERAKVTGGNAYADDGFGSGGPDHCRNGDRRENA